MVTRTRLKFSLYYIAYLVDNNLVRIHELW